MKYTEQTREAFKRSAKRTKGKHPMIPDYYNKKYGKKKSNLSKKFTAWKTK